MICVKATSSGADLMTLERVSKCFFSIRVTRVPFLENTKVLHVKSEAT